MKINSESKQKENVLHLPSERLYDPLPHGQLLSNGRYTTFITNAGTGFSCFEEYALTRWHAERIEDGEGFFLYLRDIDSGQLWSLGHQPVRYHADKYEASFYPNRVEISCLHQGIEVRMQACVPQHDNLELRHFTLNNHTAQSRRIELTSYAEVVLNHRAADAAHPAFSKLFVQTEYLSEQRALLAKRRPRSTDEPDMLMIHWLAANDTIATPQYETDRAAFIGRGRDLAQPVALEAKSPLSGTAGNVLDPIFSLRTLVELEPYCKKNITYALGAAHGREEAITLIKRYADPSEIDLALHSAGDQDRDSLDLLGITACQAQDFQQMSTALLYGDPRLRASEEILLRHSGHPYGLGHYGVTGALPLIVVQLTVSEWEKVLIPLVKAHAFWKSKSLASNMLILIDTSIRDYRDAIVQAIKDHSHILKTFISGGNIAVRCSDELTSQDLTLALCSARILIKDEIPELQIQESSLSGKSLQYGQSRRQQFIPATLRESSPSSIHSTQPDKDEELLFFNGYGGFTQDGKEYVIRVTYPDPGLPPLPWINVIANESFGAIISERGAGFTWSMNSREHRLTPWYNDPITDPHGEALYLRDEQAAVFWSPTPGPVPQKTSYTVRHGFGYTKYQHTSHQLEQEVCVFVPRHDPVKVIRLTLHNLSDDPRKFSVFSYQRLVLGVQVEDNAGFISTRYDVASNALMASHRVQEEYSGRVCFATMFCPKQDGAVSYTTDREGFIGRNRNATLPLALCDSTCLDGHTGSGLDPCLALKLPVELAPNETLSCTLLLGEADTEDKVRALIKRYQQAAATDQALIEIQSFWDQTLSRLQIQTPSPAIDVMVNGWLAYQNLCCRIWARSAFYQSGGAFGFRDQLQDAAAMIYLLPDLTRQQILRHAEHQFVEGDVLHWWHPPTSVGIRTRFSDDLLWLPLFSAYYVRITGDHSILDQQVGFIHSRPLQQGEDEAFLAPEHSAEHADLYEHCCRALDRSLTKGSHGLPLMGTGDWNDGMNRVGREGRGESVWLGFFIYYILEGFIPLCKARHDRQRVQRYENFRAHLMKTLNDTGWDGAWYRRAYFDDGTPLGAAENEECRIDALAQAWAVISKAAPQRRIEQAMDALEKYLVSEETGMIRLLSPPFDLAPWDPGYIKGYLPGVRENGGQYTHAALWAIQALAEAGRTTKAATMLEKISPVSHARTPEEVAVYQVEPYVIAADVYAVAPHVGRGGWTWYTGSAGWMYRVALESLLGFQLADGDTLLLKPRIPATWKGFKIRYLLADSKTSYHISVSNDSPTQIGEVISVNLDGKPLEIKDATARIPLVKDAAKHSVRIQLGSTLTTTQRNQS